MLPTMPATIAETITNFFLFARAWIANFFLFARAWVANFVLFAMAWIPAGRKP